MLLLLELFDRLHITLVNTADAEVRCQQRSCFNLKCPLCTGVLLYWAIPENIHTLPTDDVGNPVRNAQWVWLEIHKFPQNFVNFNWNSRKTIQIFAKSGIPQARFWISRFWNPKLQLSFLEILKFLGTQFSVVHRGVWIFSGIAHQIWHSF